MRARLKKPTAPRKTFRSKRPRIACAPNRSARQLKRVSATKQKPVARLMKKPARSRKPLLRPPLTHPMPSLPHAAGPSRMLRLMRPSPSRRQKMPPVAVNVARAPRMIAAIVRATQPPAQCATLANAAVASSRFPPPSATMLTASGHSPRSSAPVIANANAVSAVAISVRKSRSRSRYLKPSRCRTLQVV